MHFNPAAVAAAAAGGRREGGGGSLVSGEAGGATFSGTHSHSRRPAVTRAPLSF